MRIFILGALLALGRDLSSAPAGAGGSGTWHFSSSAAPRLGSGVSLTYPRQLGEKCFSFPASAWGGRAHKKMEREARLRRTILWHAHFVRLPFASRTPNLW